MSLDWFTMQDMVECVNSTQIGPSQLEGSSPGPYSEARVLTGEPLSCCLPVTCCRLYSIKCSALSYFTGTQSAWHFFSFTHSHSDGRATRQPAWPTREHVGFSVVPRDTSTYDRRSQESNQRPRLGNDCSPSWFASTTTVSSSSSNIMSTVQNICNWYALENKRILLFTEW